MIIHFRSGTEALHQTAMESIFECFMVLACSCPAGLLSIWPLFSVTLYFSAYHSAGLQDWPEFQRSAGLAWISAVCRTGLNFSGLQDWPEFQRSAGLACGNEGMSQRRAWFITAPNGADRLPGRMEKVWTGAEAYPPVCLFVSACEGHCWSSAFWVKIGSQGLQWGPLAFLYYEDVCLCVSTRAACHHRGAEIEQ